MIYLIRHGQTNWNLEKRNQGQTDIELNLKGIEQAAEVAEKLSSVKFDICFSSPLKRALKTARIVCKNNIIVDERLKERCNGQLEGTIVTEGLIDFNDPNDVRFGIEPLNNFRYRIESFFNEILEKYKDKNVLVVTHAGVILWTQVYFYGIPEDGKYNKYKLENSEILKIDNSDGVNWKSTK